MYMLAYLHGWVSNSEAVLFLSFTWWDQIRKGTCQVYQAPLDAKSWIFGQCCHTTQQFHVAMLESWLILFFEGNKYPTKYLNTHTQALQGFYRCIRVKSGLIYLNRNIYIALYAYIQRNIKSSQYAMYYRLRNWCELCRLN